ncbi:hypothetical protein QCE49_31890 [Caballeronia sp. LZ008]|uniref:hypothetical protein n=1 Tax=Caballeronia sp. LZ008 TaxID=3038560 RepID=UPI002861742C|nr:hypothetical protein [Caballeronia sp. LZ008]MDR5798010.1 hypothetical protein [Caballeronia sp. LZ008]
MARNQNRMTTEGWPIPITALIRLERDFGSSANQHEEPGKFRYSGGLLQPLNNFPATALSC